MKRCDAALLLVMTGMAWDLTGDRWRLALYILVWALAWVLLKISR